jgi:hypothetical protein
VKALSLSRTLLTRLIGAQALTLTASMALFPLFAPYVSYSNIAD